MSIEQYAILWCISMLALAVTVTWLEPRQRPMARRRRAVLRAPHPACQREHFREFTGRQLHSKDTS